MGWFYGFKLHAIINPKGELLRIKLMPGNVDDCKPTPELCQGLFGQLFADKGHIVQWLTGTGRSRSSTDHAPQEEHEALLRIDFEKASLRRCSLIETVFDELKNLCQIEHACHRSHFNFVVNLMRVLPPIACPTTSPLCL